MLTTASVEQPRLPNPKRICCAANEIPFRQYSIEYFGCWTFIYRTADGECEKCKTRMLFSNSILNMKEGGIIPLLPALKYLITVHVLLLIDMSHSIHIDSDTNIQSFHFLAGQNSKFAPFYRFKIRNSPLFIGSKFKIHPFLSGQNSNFTPFYWVKIRNMYTPFYWVNNL